MPTDETTTRVSPRRWHRVARIAVACAVLSAAVAVPVVAFVGAGASAVPRSGTRGGAPMADHHSSSPFDVRGIIEGFYGKPHSHADRVDLLHWESAHHMNTFIEAAKADEHVRAKWRHQYPPSTLRRLLKEVRLAASLGIDWVPDIGPGKPLIPSQTSGRPDKAICYSCAADLKVLVDRFRPFVQAGSHAVMVSFDDAQKTFTDPRDTAKYGRGDAAFGRANADLLNRLAKALPHTHIYTVLTDYQGTESTSYLAGVGQHLDPGITVFWTGTAVVPKKITAEQAKAYGDLLGRKVVVWDNYPANDYAGNMSGQPTNLFLGPLVGRGPDLGSAAKGLVANPMNEWQASKIALGTLADYLGDPTDYHPETSWRRSIRDFAGADTRWVTRLAASSRVSPIQQRAAVIVAPLATKFQHSYADADWPAARDKLHEALVTDANAAGKLKAHGFNAGFRKEAKAFLAQLTRQAHAGLAAIDLLAAERPKLTVAVHSHAGGGAVVTGHAEPVSASAIKAARATLDSAEKAARSYRQNVYGSRELHNPNGATYSERNRMDHFVRYAQRQDAAFAPKVAQAARGISVTVDGKRVHRHGGAGTHFRVHLDPGESVHIVATGSAGEKTGREVRADRPDDSATSASKAVGGGLPTVGIAAGAVAFVALVALALVAVIRVRRRA